jgi:DNA (cytosine-5)-methyltransferase 1
VTVQTRRNPNNERFGMKHLGDITKIKGCDAPVVDCIIGGSPCQDLSLAGKRAGLAGARSGLYMEQIRIIKEMRHNDEQRGRTGESIRPRYMVWENVPGAFSTNGGKDFAAVLEEAIRVAEPEAPDVPVPEKGWPTSGCFFDEMGKWSVAWRVLDAQFWGVPQRRRRIALVADFGGQSAPEILFIRKGVSRDFDESEQTRKATAGDARECSGGAVPCTLKIRGGCDGGGKGALIQEVQTVTFEPGIASREGGHVYNGVSGTLRANAGDNQMSVAYSIENHPADSRVDIDDSGKVQTLTSRMGTGGGNVPMVMEPAYCIGNVQVDQLGLSEKVGTLNCMHDQQAVLIPAVAHTLRAKASGGFSLNCNQVVRVKHIVRRLTPLECERLQGYPDGWTDIGEWVDSKGKKHKEADSPRYKALGNSIAIPPWKWVLKRLCACYERDATMASLFDGIGGFPYIWEQLNGNGSCLWASEIEEFPMAVTKIRFGGED